MSPAPLLDAPDSVFSDPRSADLVALFDALPGVIFYAKDRESRFVAANRAMLEVKRLERLEELLGKTDHDFHPALLADAYVREDREVMERDEPLLGQTWFIVDRFGRPGWHLSSKVPLHDASGAVCGVAGVRQAIDTPEDRERFFRKLAPVVRHLEEHCHENIDMAEMAALAGLSTTHFNREFRAVFRISPLRFVHALRTEKARQLLASTDEPVGEIALATGYYDQSHFTRHFRRVTGMSPLRYRKRFRGGTD